jgi:hypothetical protein
LGVHQITRRAKARGQIKGGTISGNFHKDIDGLMRRPKTSSPLSTIIMSNLSFSLLTPPTTRFGPRLGAVFLKRAHDNNNEIQIQTPGFLTSTSRGVIPHLSRDHYASTGIRWVNVPFESL